MTSLPLTVGLLLSVCTFSQAARIDLPIQLQNTYHSVTVGLGTPPKTFRLIPDTGSVTSWVLNTNCAPGSRACPNGSGYTRVPYDPAASNTSVATPYYGAISYIAGVSVGGSIYEDVMSFTSTSGVPVLFNQTFIDAEASGWRFLPGDGYFGLGFSTAAEPHTESIFETMVQAGVVDEPKFSIYFGNGTDPVDENMDIVPNDGVLTLGGSRADDYVEGGAASVKRFDLVPPYEVWKTGASEVRFSGAANKTLSLADTSIVFDTGASNLAVPTSLIEEMYAAIGANYTALLHGVPLQCSQMNASWSLELTIGGTTEQTISLTGAQLAHPGLGRHAEWCIPPFDDLGGEGTFIAGNWIIARFYSEWDLGATEVADYQPTLGFGVLKSGL